MRATVDAMSARVVIAGNNKGRTPEGPKCVFAITGKIVSLFTQQGWYGQTNFLLPSLRLSSNLAVIKYKEVPTSAK